MPEGFEITTKIKRTDSVWGSTNGTDSTNSTDEVPELKVFGIVTAGDVPFESLNNGSSMNITTDGLPFTLDTAEKCLNIFVKKSDDNIMDLSELSSNESKGLYIDLRLPINLEYTITRLSNGWKIKPLEFPDTTDTDTDTERQLTQTIYTNVTVGEGPPG